MTLYVIAAPSDTGKTSLCMLKHRKVRLKRKNQCALSSEKRQWTKFSAYPDWAAAKPRGDSSPAHVPSQMASRPPLDCQTNSSAIQVDCLESYRSAVCSHFNLLFISFSFFLLLQEGQGQSSQQSRRSLHLHTKQNKDKNKKTQQTTKLFLIKDSSYQEIQSTTTFSGFLMS